MNTGVFFRITLHMCVCVCVCVIVGHTDRPAQQSNQFVTDVKLIVKKKKKMMTMMIMVMILPSRSDDDKDTIYGNKK